MSDQHIVILGLMGVGKSTTGRALADAIDLPYSDSDDEIERLLGQPGGVFARRCGVELLHQLEAALLLGALARPDPHVITAAASVVENELVNLVMPDAAVVVRLGASIETTLARQAEGDHRRAMTVEELTELAARREPLFERVTDLELDANVPTDILVAKVIQELQTGSRTTRSKR